MIFVLLSTIKVLNVLILINSKMCFMSILKFPTKIENRKLLVHQCWHPHLCSLHIGSKQSNSKHLHTQKNDAFHYSILT